MHKRQRDGKLLLTASWRSRFSYRDASRSICCEPPGPVWKAAVSGTGAESTAASICPA